MNTHKLFATLRHLQAYMQDNHPNINRGGCGVFAFMVGEKLQGLGLEVDIITPCGMYEGVPAKDIRAKVGSLNNASEWGNNGLSLWHLAVRFKTKSGIVYTYDSDGFKRSSDDFGKNDRFCTDPEFGSGLTVEETKEISMNPEGWNTSFPRRTIPEIQAEIDRLFKPNMELDFSE
jgi:hypothetical protein